MEYKVDTTLDQFDAWSGGNDTLKVLIEKGVCDEVEEFIEQCFTDPTDTDINDFLWFERDQIAEYLGYKDWDAFENGEDDDAYEDMNGTPIHIGDKVHWDDEAGVDEDGSDIIFTVVEDYGDGYFNIAYEGEENPERWAYWSELEVLE